MTPPRVLGVVGTLVWDRLVGHAQGGGTIEAWGGISYALAALGVALPKGWVARPILEIGEDVAGDADAWIARLPRVDGSAVEIVPEPNNRVEISYDARGGRTERLTGGVPPWTWPELRSKVLGCDALYVNFISGYEMELADAQALAREYEGPTWADLHSLFLGRDARGLRIPRPLEAWAEWLGCWHAIQLNEDELALLGTGVADPWSRVTQSLERRVEGRQAPVRGAPWPADGRELGPRPWLVAVTLGARGAAYATAAGFRSDPRGWPVSMAGAGAPVRGSVGEGVEPRAGDPTGCGDVWGATCFARLLAGDGLQPAMREANRLAGLSAELRGATDLPGYLRRADRGVEASAGGR